MLPGRQRLNPRTVKRDGSKSTPGIVTFGEAQEAAYQQHRYPFLFGFEPDIASLCLVLLFSFFALLVLRSTPHKELRVDIYNGGI